MELLARYVLPLSCCPTTNETIGAPWYRVQKLRHECFTRMLAQHLKQFGDVRQRYDKSRRVVIDCMRYSSRQPDATSNFSKIPVDILCRRKGTSPMGGKKSRSERRLGLIFDDGPEYASVHEKWTWAPQKEGRVEIFVYAQKSD